MSPAPTALAVPAAPLSAAAEPTSRLSDPRLKWALGTCAATLVILNTIPAGFWISLVLLSVPLAFSFPLALSLAGPKLQRVFLVIVVVVAATALIAGPVQRARGQNPAASSHDGGVFVTRASAERLIQGQDPYAVSYREDLPKEWLVLFKVYRNPVIDHQPYLPLWIAAQVPAVFIGDLIGQRHDPRVLGVGAALAFIAVVLTRRRPAWVSCGAVMVMVSPLALDWISWGSTDVFATALAGIGSLLLFDSPRSRRSFGIASVLFALALSAKLLVAPIVLISLVMVYRRGGLRALKDLWPGAALFAGSIVPFLLWHPGDFIDDVMLYNLGMSKENFPTSGLGLAAQDGPLSHGMPLLLVTVILFLVTTVLLPLIAWKRPDPRLAGVLGAIGVLGLVVPSRTFQANYLILVVGALAPTWILAFPRRAVDARITKSPENSEIQP